MTELWETTFAEPQTMLGTEPSRSAVFARDYFARVDAKEILIPGIGYDWYETLPGVKVFFYDAESIRREIGSARARSSCRRSTRR